MARVHDKSGSPRLSVEEAVRFLAMPEHGNEYRKRCLTLWEELHGKEYAEQIRQELWVKLKKRRNDG
jgi:hypothetical protein